LPAVAPYKAAVFPLLKNKPDLVAKARGIYNDLLDHMPVVWDERGNIGKRYFYQDEIGTPFCVTVDFDTLDTNKVTIRHRDTMAQDLVDVSQVRAYLQDRM
jgi:glycyl-tRNA synthetase